MAKYLIEKNDKETIIRVYVNNDGKADFTQAYLAPYTEPDMEQVRKEAYENGYENGFVAGHLKAEKSGQSFYEDGYKRGLSDAWEAARKIASDNAGQNYSIFGQHFTAEILNTHSASEAIEEIRAYEQKQGEQIQVGDEIIINDPDFIGDKAVVVNTWQANGSTWFYAVTCNGDTFSSDVQRISKTGRYFPEIAEVLRKMKEDPE